MLKVQCSDVVYGETVVEDPGGGRAMKRYSTFPLIDAELNRQDERVTKLVEQVEQLTNALKKLQDRKKPGPKPK